VVNEVGPDVAIKRLYDSLAQGILHIDVYWDWSESAVEDYVRACGIMYGREERPDGFPLLPVETFCCLMVLRRFNVSYPPSVFWRSQVSSVIRRFGHLPTPLMIQNFLQTNNALSLEPEVSIGSCLRYLRDSRSPVGLTDYMFSNFPCEGEDGDDECQQWYVSTWSSFRLRIINVACEWVNYRYNAPKRLRDMGVRILLWTAENCDSIEDFD
jgi:hypothetical protein